MIELNVKSVLEKQGKSQYWLAKETGISPNNIGKICNGETKNIRLDTMDKICNALNCIPNDILFFQRTILNKYRPLHNYITLNSFAILIAA